MGCNRCPGCLVLLLFRNLTKMILTIPYCLGRPIVNRATIIVTTLIAACLSGCNASEDNEPECGGEDTSCPSAQSAASEDGTIFGQLWLLNRYEDSAGNVNPVESTDDFQFTLYFDLADQRVGGINVCNAYLGDFLLEDGVVTFMNLAEDTADCESANNSPAEIYRGIVDGESASSSVMFEYQSDNTLEIMTPNNDTLYFESACLSDELIFTCPWFRNHQIETDDS